MIIYSHKIAPRLQYITAFLSDFFQHPFHLISDADRYDKEKDFKINYSAERINLQELYIHPHTLLFERGTKEFSIECFRHNNYVAFFKTGGDHPFDLFASIFFLLSRYEEYLPHQKNKYGLFDHTNSLAFKQGFLKEPLINNWLEDFRSILEEKFPGITLPRKDFGFIPTYDIDLPWRYKAKPFKVHYGNLLRSLLKGQLREVKERLRVVNGHAKDPFDAFDWMDVLHRKFNLVPLYFLLVASKKGKHDKNPDLKNESFIRLIKTLSGKYKTGLHPSWYSGDHEESLVTEKAWLEDVTGEAVDSSRQHFLRFKFPDTFQRLLSAGIRNDYSMGYNAVNGFRASIASSFYWYDLRNETTTPLKIHPFCFMDATSFYYQGLRPEQAEEELMYFYTTIQSIRGTMITLWHNNFLGTAEEFSGWRAAYERFVTTICKGSDNLIDGPVHQVHTI